MKNPFSIYQRLVSEADLYGGAFFGHEITKAERKKLNRLWVKACKIAVKNGNYRIIIHRNRIMN